MHLNNIVFVTVMVLLDQKPRLATAGIFEGSCPKRLTPHPGLEDYKMYMKDLLGTWYTHVRYHSPHHSDRCESMTFDANTRRGVIRLTYRAIDDRGKSVTKISHVTPHPFPDGIIWDTEEEDTCSEGQSSPRQLPHWLIDLHTGPTGHLTLWACEDIVQHGSLLTHRLETVWIMAKTQHPGDMHLGDHYWHLNEMGLDTTPFVFVNHTDCDNRSLFPKPDL